jgi:hypothetical protein
MAGFFHGRAPPNIAAAPGDGFAPCWDEGAVGPWPTELVEAAIAADEGVTDDVPDGNVTDGDVTGDEAPDDDGVDDDGVTDDSASFCDGGAALAKRQRPPIANTISATAASVGSA